MARVPITLEVGVRTFFCGPESFTPDLAPAVGEAPGIRGLLRRGRHELRRRAVGRRARPGARALDHRRAARRRRHRLRRRPVPRRPARAGVPRDRTTEILGTVYAAHTPGKQLRTARDRLLSPVHDRLVEQGGYLREVSGWEGADWFAGSGIAPEAEPTWGHAPWFEQWGQEHRAVREGVGLMDMSFMAKFPVTGDRRRRAARPAVGRRGERRARRDHLHPVAQRRRPDRGRPDRHEAGRRRLLRGRLRHRARPRAAGMLGGCARPRVLVDRRDRRLRRSSTCRARGRATSCRSSPTPTCRPTRGRSAASARSSSPGCG